MKKNTACGVITFHAPLSDSLLKTEEFTTDVKDATEATKSLFLPSVMPRSTSRRGRVEESPSRPKPGPKQKRVSHASFRHLQAKMEAESQQAREIIKPLLDAENGFVKDLERLLSQWDVTRMRKRELLHKRWTEHVWFPMHSRVEEHLSRCGPAEAKRRQGLYNQFLHQCNTKGFVFLETYDPKEYNPFPVNIKRPLYSKLNEDNLQLHERQEEKRTVSTYEAGCKYTRHAEKLPQSGRTLTGSVELQANTPLQASTNYPVYPVSASRNSPVAGETEGRTSSRLNVLPYHVRATASTDGRCHHSGCWFSRSGCRKQPASVIA